MFENSRVRHKVAAALFGVALAFAWGCSPGADASRTPVTTVAAKTPRDVTTQDDHLARAAAWLWNAQSDDGGWHSETYRLLESGQALTPFVLWALLDVPEEVCPRPPHGVERALAAIRRSINRDGAVGLADPEMPAYPNYATAHALLCLVRAGGEEDRPRIARMRDYLVGQQFREETGFGPRTVVYGGWGFGGPLPAGGSPGHMDLHHTRVVLQALRAAGVPDSEVLRRAEAFLRVVQKHPDVKTSRPGNLDEAPFAVWDAPCDGGFYFSPVVLAANKGGTVKRGKKTYYRSYASATCDGILALLACGLRPDDERMIRGMAWLDEHPQLDWPGGVPRDATENWGESIRFTHYAARAEAQSALDRPVDRRRRLAELVAAHQRDDGSFQNSVGFLMKEDDPVICTALAVSALAKTRQ